MSTKQRYYAQADNIPVAFRFTEFVSEQDIAALRAVEAGTADAYQQRLALRCIIVKISGAYDQDFVPGHADQTAFRGGRGFVGKTVQKFIKADLEVLLGAENEN